MLVDQAVAWLSERLPSSWKVERSQRALANPGGLPPTVLDATIDISSSNMVATLAVEARRSLDPRDVERLLPGLGRTIRALAGYISILVVAPWLSTRTRELLAAERINYVDLTGNALIRLENPALYLETTGSTRNPRPSEEGGARVRGPKAGRLIRLLTDVRPPYRVTELASAAGLATGYVSRLLDALDREVRSAIAQIPPARRKVISTHGAFGYFASAYGIEFIAPLGVSTESEASARDIARIITQIRTEKIPAVFLENISDVRLIRRISAETGARVGGTLFSDSLSDEKGDAPTYIELVRHNIKALTSALAN